MDDGKKRIEKTRAEEIGARAGVGNISKRIREARLRWLGQRWGWGGGERLEML